jgi:hypothetical protein
MKNRVIVVNVELEITIGVTKLLDKLKANRDRFVKSYDALLQAYEKKVTQYQKEYATYTKKIITKSKKLSTDTGQPLAPAKPEDRTKDYDFYINMLENHQGQTITLSESVYKRLWNDLWDWTRQLVYSANAYDLEEIASVYSAIVE